MAYEESQLTLYRDFYFPHKNISQHSIHFFLYKNELKWNHSGIYVNVLCYPRKRKYFGLNGSSIRKSSNKILKIVKNMNNSFM